MGRCNPVETSREAFASLKPCEIKETYDGILNALSIIKEGTFEDIAKAMKCKPDKIWKRLSELHEKYGLIFRPGNKRVLKSGRPGFTWRLTIEGEENVKITDTALPGKSVSDYSKDILKRPVGRPRNELPKSKEANLFNI
jgi:hypothetical protein